MRRFFLLLPLCLLLPACSVLNDLIQTDSTRAELIALEIDSHQRWLEGDVAALDSLMADDYRYVVMNGAVETKADVISQDADGRPRRRPLDVRHLHVEPEEVILHGTTAVVISHMEIEASVGGRRLPDEMRILSVYVRSDDTDVWMLAARSITPILSGRGRTSGR